MEIAHWSEKYETGFPIIDQQHQQMFTLVNQLQEAMVEQADPETLKQLLKELLKDTIAHFTLEEDLMQEHGYPSYAQHKQIHDRLTQKILDPLQRLKARGIRDSNRSSRTSLSYTSYSHGWNPTRFNIYRCV